MGLFYSYKSLYQSEKLVKKYMYYNIKKRFLHYMHKPKDDSDRYDLMNLMNYYLSHLDGMECQIEGELAQTVYKMFCHLKNDLRGIPAWLAVDFKRLDMRLERITK